jgi:hypothetical protein
VTTVGVDGLWTGRRGDQLDLILHLELQVFSPASILITSPLRFPGAAAYMATLQHTPYLTLNTFAALPPTSFSWSSRRRTSSSLLIASCASSPIDRMCGKSDPQRI